MPSSSRRGMGFKRTSDVIAVSARVTEPVATPNTFTQDQISLQLDALNNEVFVILAVDMALSPPDALAGTDTQTISQLTTTSQTAMTGYENSNVITRTERVIQSGTFTDFGAVFEHMAGESPQATLDYIQIVATPDLFFQVEGQNNLNPKACAIRIWGYRAKADASTYAALVQSEVLSS